MLPAIRLTQHEERECPHRQTVCENCGSSMISEVYQVSETFTSVSANPNEFNVFLNDVILQRPK